MKMSLLEFMIHSIRKSDPSLLKFPQDLAPCEVASKIELSVLSTKVSDFETGINKVKKEVQKTNDLLIQLRAEANKDDGQRLRMQELEKFSRTFTVFLKDAEEKQSEIGLRVKNIIKDIADLIILFGEDDSTKSTDFFAIFHSFAKDFTNCYKNLLLGEKIKEEKEARRRAQEALRERNRSGSGLNR